LPPQVGVYGYLLGGLGYALLGSSRQLAIGPTSAISLMIAGTVSTMADGDAQRYMQIASLAGFTVALLCLISWLLRLSTLVRLISDSILVGFKAGACRAAPGMASRRLPHQCHHRPGEAGGIAIDAAERLDVVSRLPWPTRSRTARDATASCSTRSPEVARC
jgi:hypothetical protein